MLSNHNEIKKRLWKVADQLRATKLTSSEYCMRVLGLIFLRHATNVETVTKQIGEYQANPNKVSILQVRSDLGAIYEQ